MDDTLQIGGDTVSSTDHKGKIHGGTKKGDKSVILIDEEKDSAPKPLNPEVFSTGTERQINVYDVGGPERLDATVSGSVSMNIFKSQSTIRFRTDVDKQQLDQSLQYNRSLSFGSNLMDAFIIEISSEKSSDSMSDTFRTNSEEFDGKEDMREILTHISLILSETDTFIVLDIPSSTAIKDTDEGNIVEEQNQHYEYLTVGKGRNRKVVTAEVQTVPILKKSRNTEAAKVKTRNSYAYVSNYEMFDTYQELAKGIGDDSDESNESEIEVHHKVGDTSSINSYHIPEDERQLNKLMKNQRFLESVCVIERLLANNCYNEEQKWFRGLSIPSDFRENIEYNYKLSLLWTFANEYTKGKSVNAFHWNPSNKDILAVGYGKYYFTDNIPGLVLIWNIKNPVQPERQYEFPESVTALNFSKKTPNLLAVGFYNGHVVILNVVSRETMVVGENTPPFEPVWYLIWQDGHNEYKNMEVVYGIFSDGRIYLYSLDRKLKEQQLMRVALVEGKLKGYDAMAQCTSITMPISRYAAGYIFTPHPINSDIYFIGTSQGIVHKCSKNYLNQHLECFYAHFGTIRALKFSPFAPKIFATCGDDWSSRLWAEGIEEPIVQFFVTQQSVLGYDWNPAISTIIATIRGTGIMLWDFQRKVYAPQSSVTSPTGTRNTLVEFTDSGRCLVVGDIDGNVHIFALDDIPFVPFFQENSLFEALFRALVTDPDLLRKLKKVRKSSFQDQKVEFN